MNVANWPVGTRQGDSTKLQNFPLPRIAKQQHAEYNIQIQQDGLPRGQFISHPQSLVELGLAYKQRALQRQQFVTKNESTIKPQSSGSENIEAGVLQSNMNGLNSKGGENMRNTENGTSHAEYHPAALQTESQLFGHSSAVATPYVEMQSGNALDFYRRTARPQASHPHIFHPEATHRRADILQTLHSPANNSHHKPACSQVPTDHLQQIHRPLPTTSSHSYHPSQQPITSVNRAQGRVSQAYFQQTPESHNFGGGVQREWQMECMRRYTERQSAATEQHNLSRQRRPTNENGVVHLDINCSVEIMLIPSNASLANLCRMIDRCGKIRSIQFTQGLTSTTKKAVVVFTQVMGAHNLLRKFSAESIYFGSRELRALPGFVHMYSNPPLESDEYTRVLLISSIGNDLHLRSIIQYCRSKEPSVSLIHETIPAQSTHDIQGGRVVHELHFSSIDEAVAWKRILEAHQYYSRILAVVFGPDPCDVSLQKYKLSNDGKTLIPIST